MTHNNFGYYSRIITLPFTWRSRCLTTGNKPQCGTRPVCERRMPKLATAALLTCNGLLEHSYSYSSFHRAIASMAYHHVRCYAYIVHLSAVCSPPSMGMPMDRLLRLEIQESHDNWQLRQASLCLFSTNWIAIKQAYTSYHD